MPVREALIIACSQYSDPSLDKLVAPAQDADALSMVLENPDVGGYEAETLFNKQSYQISQAIEKFFSGRKRDDLLLLYFSGHGVKDEEGRLYFAAPDTDRKRLRTTAIPAALINDVMLRSRSRKQVLILDCCYSGAFAKGLTVKSDKVIGSSLGTREYLGGQGRVVLTASDALQYAFEGDKVEGEGVRSVFTRSLVYGLETGKADLNGNGRITFDELYEYVYDDVVEKTPQQRPEKWALGVKGNIVIARNPVWNMPAGLLPEWIMEALESPNFARRIAGLVELRDLLLGEDTLLAARAQQELERLSNNDPDESVRGAAAGALGLTFDATALAEPSLDPKPEPAYWERSLALMRRYPFRFAAILLFAILALWLIYAQFADRSDQSPVTQADSNEAATASSAEEANLPPEIAVLHDTWTRPADGMTMVYVPGGTHLMGSPESELDVKSDELPQHVVRLNDFWIDKTEVTNAMYEKCVADGSCTASLYVNDVNLSQGDQPVVGISWDEAAQYCAWAGAQLPDEAQWEYAARGPESFTYPWGNNLPDETLLNYLSNTGKVAPAGSYPDGKSWVDALDMAGNVWEWTDSWYQAYLGNEEPNDDYGEIYRVARGGAWLSNENDVRSSFRIRFAPSNRYGIVGFRCVIPSV